MNILSVGHTTESTLLKKPDNACKKWTKILLTKDNKKQ